MISVNSCVDSADIRNAFPGELFNPKKNLKFGSDNSVNNKVNLFLLVSSSGEAVHNDWTRLTIRPCTDALMSGGPVETSNEITWNNSGK